MASGLCVPAREMWSGCLVQWIDCGEKREASLTRGRESECALTLLQEAQRRADEMERAARRREVRRLGNRQTITDVRRLVNVVALAVAE
jgi:hypothetical protein